MLLLVPTQDHSVSFPSAHKDWAGATQGGVPFMGTSEAALGTGRPEGRV